MMIVGIDFGSSTTKIVLLDGKDIVKNFRIVREHSYEDILKTFDQYSIEKIATVGSGASSIKGDILGIPTVMINEFDALASGGKFLTGLDDFIAVSIGTGTAFLYVHGEEVIHAGGSGIGGALLTTLSKLNLQEDNIDRFFALAQKGLLDNSDLLIKDISKDSPYILNGNVTVANMSKITVNSRPEDCAFGISNLIFQNIGVMAVMCAKPYISRKIVIMGSFSHEEIVQQSFKAVGKLCDYDFLFPNNSLYAVAIGAALLA